MVVVTGISAPVGRNNCRRATFARFGSGRQSFPAILVMQSRQDLQITRACQPLETTIGAVRSKRGAEAPRELPHRALSLTPPEPRLPAATVSASGDARVLRRDRLGGVVHEDVLAA